MTRPATPESCPACGGVRERHLEQQLDLAKMEMRGHMMIEDDLKFEVSKLLEDVKVCDLRIAELEKDAARLDWLIDNCPYWPLYGGNIMKECSRAAIDAALKSRP